MAAALRATSAEDRQHQAEGGDQFAEPLAGPGSDDGAGLDRREVEHQVGDDDAEDRAGKLGDNIGGGVPPADLAAQGEGEGDRRIEMGARDRPQHQDQDDENGAGRQGIAEERDAPDCRRRAARP